MYDPEREGIDHINAYSKSRTSAGRLLSNFAHTPFTLPANPKVNRPEITFGSIEAVWYWLSCEGSSRRDELIPLYGFAAKQLGRELRGADWPQDPGFPDKIRYCIDLKIEQNPTVRTALIDTGTLPIVHYYHYHGKVIIPTKGHWIWQHYMERRNENHL